MSALARWDAFLGQIEARAASVRSDAEATGRAFIASVAAGGDYVPMSHQLMAVNNRLQDLEKNITDTWHAKVDDAIAAENLGEDRRWAAFGKGEALRHALDDLREELEPRLFAELSRQRYQHAIAQKRDVRCAKCGQPLATPLVFRAIDLACACGARTPYEPGELMRSVAAIGAHAVAQESVNREWRAMRAAERALHAVRPPRPLAVVKTYERAQIAYWRAYLGVRSQYEPELGVDIAMEIRSRMEQWYVSSAEFEEAWVAAGRPRDVV